MLLPIKLINKFWPRWFMKLSGSYCKQDPSILFYGTDSPDLFSKAITNLRFGTTNKTTKPGRHQLCNKLMLSNIDFTNKTILDVGASDGSTSFDLINLLSNKFNNYFVTDYNLFVDISCVGKMFYFFDTRTNQCILISNNQFVIYPQESKLILFFLNSKISNASRQIKKRVKLIQPELVKYANSNPEKIYIEQFNIFEPWVAATPDIIKVSNVLNRDYFSDDMIKRAISVMKSYLKNDGYLVISDNREIEKVSLYQLKDNRFLKLIEINSGTEISNLVS